jgi:hypothetical protein
MHFLIFALGLLLNIFFGWTVVGWFVVLAMAICSAPYYVYFSRRGW